MSLYEKGQGSLMNVITDCGTEREQVNYADGSPKFPEKQQTPTCSPASTPLLSKTFDWPV